jgi:MOSC domain-containing protein YiiM
MRVLSVNLATARSIDYRGETHPTGIFKMPTHGSVAVTRLGVAGDRVCDLLNHGGADKAVYAFALDHFDHWRSVLEKPGLGPGAFGENLTMAGLDEAAICIGDQLSVGSALLEVSQPRVPCFKLGVALGDDRAPGLFTRHFRTGVYFRVLREGEISEGDSAEVTRSHPEKISIYSLFRAFYDRDYPDREALLARARALPVLASEWRGKLRTRR